MKKYTITEKEYIEMVEAMNTLSGENHKLRGFIDGMREQLLINGVVVPNSTLCECGNVKPHEDQSHCQMCIEEAFDS